jgi:hypothetical protein
MVKFGILAHVAACGRPGLPSRESCDKFLHTAMIAAVRVDAMADDWL